MDGIAVVGSGYVGTVVAVCFSLLGHRVVGVEQDERRLRALTDGRAPWYEPDLNPLLVSGLTAGRLSFTSSIPEALDGADVVFLCVGASGTASGRPDLRPLERAGRAIGAVFDGQIIVNKSTVPIGGVSWLASIIEQGRPLTARRRGRPSVVANPEFLREGTAVADFLHPYRVVLGGEDAAAVSAVARLYRPILDQTFAGGDPNRRPVLVRTAGETAEVLKYAANAFLAMKISFANELANICATLGVDVLEVTAGIGLDPRIGSDFLRPGLGWGGSCLGKDLAALITTARDGGYEPELLVAVGAVNERQRLLAVQLLRHHLTLLTGRRICVLGLSFKAGTDDVRDSPAVGLVEMLVAHGAVVTAYDPVVREMPGNVTVTVHDDPYTAADRADAVVVATDWPSFLELDFGEVRRRMHGRLLIDARNHLDPTQLKAAGFQYERLGNPRPPLAGRVELDLDELEAELAEPKPGPPVASQGDLLANDT